MALFRYTGEPGRIWPDVPVTPDVGDVVDWRDITPDETNWTPVRSAKDVRENDNGPYVASPEVDLGPQDTVPDPPADPPVEVDPDPAAPPADQQES